MESTYIWAGILFCLTQSAMFSGLNLAFFGLSRLQLEAEAETNPIAQRVLSMRKDSNFLLTTILWGNVSINVLLTLLSSSVLAGVSAFMFSTIVITFLGEIIPQAYFSRHSLRMASMLSPLLRLYQFLLYPVAKPSAVMLDKWLGKEAPQYFRERVIKDMLLRHVEAHDSDVGDVEGIGALNFLDIDEVAAYREGEVLDPQSIIRLPVEVDLPQFPEFTASADDPFIQKIHSAKKKWVVLVDATEQPLLLLDADDFLRRVFLQEKPFSPYDSCHRPIVVDEKTSLGDVMYQLKSNNGRVRGSIKHDVILVKGDFPRIITGTDLFERLLQGIH